MNIAIGADNRGFALKQEIMKLLAGAGHQYQDFGTYSEDAVDYPDIAQEVAKAVAGGRFERGILICYTGNGMCISANKVKGIRAALSHDAATARLARQHNDANILCLGAIEAGQKIPEIVETFLKTEFEGGRHLRRVNKIKAIEGDN